MNPDSEWELVSAEEVWPGEIVEVPDGLVVSSRRAPDPRVFRRAASVEVNEEGRTVVITFEDDSRLRLNRWAPIRVWRGKECPFCKAGLCEVER